MTRYGDAACSCLTEQDVGVKKNNKKKTIILHSENGVWLYKVKES